MSLALLSITERPQRPRSLRLRFDPPVRCPAGTPVAETAKGSGCFCAIERGVMAALDNPMTLHLFCCDNYALCTSWQVEKEHIAEGWMSDRDEMAERADEAARRRNRDDLIEMNREVEVTHFERE